MTGAARGSSAGVKKRRLRPTVFTRTSSVARAQALCPVNVALESTPVVLGNSQRRSDDRRESNAVISKPDPFLRLKGITTRRDTCLVFAKSSFLWLVLASSSGVPIGALVATRRCFRR